MHACNEQRGGGATSRTQGTQPQLPSKGSFDITISKKMLKHIGRVTKPSIENIMGGLGESFYILHFRV